jgi:hypothetical protein
MRFTRWTRISLLVALPLVMFGVIACNDDNDVTGSGGALASLNLDMPETVNSGAPFDASLTATAIGVTNVQNGVATVTFPAPIQVTAVDAEAGTSATFNGGTVTWTLNTLDSNTSSTLTIHAMGTLPVGSANQTLTVQSSMVADGISNGELVASENFTLAQ